MAKVSILILTHNAPDYVRETIKTINEVTDSVDLKETEIIVWDNASEKETISVLQELYEINYIDKIYYSNENLLFAGGNNRCAELADKDAEYYLLLNSDVRITNKKWLHNLLSNIENSRFAVVAYGVCSNPNRVDGYCYLIKRELYDKYPLNEDFQWFWGITQQQSCLLKDGYDILGFYSHENQIVHYGGGSGTDFNKAKKNNIDIEEIFRWYQGGKGSVYFRLAPGNSWIVYKIKCILRKVKKKLPW